MGPAFGNGPFFPFFGCCGLFGGASTVIRMGFNPFREQKKGLLDVAMVVAAVAVTIALVAWGFLGG